MTGIVCAIVGNFSTAVAAQIIRLKKGIIAVGNAQIDTAQSKFGGASALFDGTGDYLTVDNLSMANDFTFECWVRFNALPTSSNFMMLATVDGNRYIGLLNNAGTQRWESSVMTGSNQYVARYTPTITTGVWYHIALVKSGSTLTFYQDGTSVAGSTIAGSMTSTSTLFTSGTNILGAYTSANYSLNGWMDEIRISNTARYTANFTAPTEAFVNDDNTLLLIHADGTDASTFFEDDNGLTPFSTRTAKTFTVFNQAQIDTAQYKFGSSSYLGDGTGDYIVSSTANDLQFTGDFTVELWVRLASTGAIRVPIGNRLSGTGAGIWWVEIGSDQAGYSAWQNTAGTSYYPTYSGTISANTWTHLAVVRNGSNLTFYKDGVGGTAVTGVTGTFGLTTGGIYVGGIAASYNWNGHIDEVRISKTARYTANFTPSTGPFNSDSNTVLLMHMEGTDASTTFTDDVFGVRTQKGIQALGNAQIDTAQSKFGGASALFDGTGDYLIVQSNPIPTSGSFTVEFWIRFSSLGVLRPIWSNRDTGGTNRGVLYISSANTITWWNGGDNLNHTSTLSANTWYHIACVKDGSTRRLFVDGGGMVTDSAIYTAGDLFQIGRADYTSTAFTSEIAGHIDEFRVSNTARYTTTFTPSTTPFVNDDNTLLLMHCDGTDAATVFRDDNGTGRSQRGIIAIGNAQIDTAQSKFGGSSLLLDGTDDRLEINPTTTYNDFTVECWIRLANNSGTKNILSFGNESSGRVFFAVYNDRIYWDQYGVTSRYGNTSISANVWYHLAWSRTGSTIKLFVDGVEQTMTTLSGSGAFPSGAVGNTNGIFVGTLSDGAIDFNGHIDEIRVSDSVRYTTGFTAPTAPFSNDSNTLLLIHADGTDGSTVFIDDNGKTPVTP